MHSLGPSTEADGETTGRCVAAAPAGGGGSLVHALFHMGCDERGEGRRDACLGEPTEDLQPRMRLFVVAVGWRGSGRALTREVSGGYGGCRERTAMDARQKPKTVTSENEDVREKAVGVTSYTLRASGQ